eukprot:gene7910-biopygen16593
MGSFLGVTAGACGNSECGSCVQGCCWSRKSLPVDTPRAQGYSWHCQFAHVSPLGCKGPWVHVLCCELQQNSPSWVRTSDLQVNSLTRYRLRHGGHAAAAQISHGVVVSTQDSESCDRGSNPRGRIFSLRPHADHVDISRWTAITKHLIESLCAWPCGITRWSPKGTSAKIGTIQRRLAWSLRKDDTH